MELGIHDLKVHEPYIKEFDDIVSKLFIMYHYSSELTQSAEDLAVLHDEDFSKLSGLHQIRWAASQQRALEKLDKNYPTIAMHLENVAADKHHKRKKECEGMLNHITSMKFLKMLMFLLDSHSVMKLLSLKFQLRNLRFIQVSPFLEKTLLDLSNLRGGKGKHMLRFAEKFEETGTYKGVQLNRARVLTTG